MQLGSELRADRSHRNSQWEGVESLTTTLGDGKAETVTWRVRVFPVGPQGIQREVWICRDHDSSIGFDSHNKKGCKEGCNLWEEDDRETLWKPEKTIWPAWASSATGNAGAQGGGSSTALERVQDYWSSASDRVRESAKWLATVVGIAMSALIGTSPITSLPDNPPTWWLGGAGLLLLSSTLLLIVRVLRPQATDYRDVQCARNDNTLQRYRLWSNPLVKWRETVETQQDLWLPSGVKCLKTLRQAMIVDELSLMALGCAMHHGSIREKDIANIQKAQDVRVARLREWRAAASRIVVIGEFYRLSRRSAWAIYLGGVTGLLGTAAVIAAFSWPR